MSESHSGMEMACHMSPPSLYGNFEKIELLYKELEGGDNFQKNFSQMQSNCHRNLNNNQQNFQSFSYIPLPAVSWPRPTFRPL